MSSAAHMHIHVVAELSDAAKQSIISSIVTQVNAAIKQQGVAMALSAAEFTAAINTRLDTLTQNVLTETTARQGTEAALQGFAAMNAELKQEVADLESKGVDLSLLQPVLDKFDIQNQAMSDQTAAITAAVAATAEQPTPAAPVATA